MYVYICIHTCICIHIDVYTHKRVIYTVSSLISHAFLRIHTHMYVYVYTCEVQVSFAIESCLKTLYIFIFIFTLTRTYMYMHTHTYTYIHVYFHIYLYSAGVIRNWVPPWNRSRLETASKHYELCMYILIYRGICIFTHTYIKHLCHLLLGPASKHYILYTTYLYTAVLYIYLYVYEIPLSYAIGSRLKTQPFEAEHYIYV